MRKRYFDNCLLVIQHNCLVLEKIMLKSLVWKPKILHILEAFTLFYRAGQTSARPGPDPQTSRVTYTGEELLTEGSTQTSAGEVTHQEVAMARTDRETG